MTASTSTDAFKSSCYFPCLYVLALTNFWGNIWLFYAPLCSSASCCFVCLLFSAEQEEYSGLPAAAEETFVESGSNQKKNKVAGCKAKLTAENVLLLILIHLHDTFLYDTDISSSVEAAVKHLDYMGDYIHIIDSRGPVCRI